MKTLYDAMRPTIWVLACFGIYIEKTPDENKLLKTLKFVIAITWSVFNFHAFYYGGQNVLKFVLRVDKTEEHSCTQIFGYFAHLRLEFIIILYFCIQYKTTREDYGKSLKEIRLSSMKEYKNLRLQVTGFAILIASAIGMKLFPYARFLLLNWNGIPMAMFQALLSDAHLELVFYFTGPTCSFLISIAFLVSMRLTQLESNLKNMKSHYRLANNVKIAAKIYENLAQLSKTFNDLFAPITYLLLLVQSITLIGHVCWLNSNSGNGMVNYIMAMVMNFTDYFLIVVNVIYALYSAAVNKKINKFTKTLLSIQVKDRQLVPIDLISDHVNHLIWTMEHLIKADEWFTMGFGLTLDMDMFLALIQTAYGVSTNHFKNVPLPTFD
ncbi:hypothetical protein CHUAL_005228 [Chamberlinius hualienensis]